MKKFIFSITLIVLGSVFLLFSLNWMKELVFMLNEDLFMLEIKYTIVPFLMFILGLGGLVFGLVSTIKEIVPKTKNA